MRDVADGHGAPQVVFTDPQVCAVGLTEAEARAEGFDVRAVEYDLVGCPAPTCSATATGAGPRPSSTSGARVLLGVTFAGPAVAELLHAATIAVIGEVPLDRLWHAVPSFPTVSEIWLRLLEAYGL